MKSGDANRQLYCGFWCCLLVMKSVWLETHFMCNLGGQVTFSVHSASASLFLNVAAAKMQLRAPVIMLSVAEWLADSPHGFFPF